MASTGDDTTNESQSTTNRTTNRTTADSFPETLLKKQDVDKWADANKIRTDKSPQYKASMEELRKIKKEMDDALENATFSRELADFKRAKAEKKAMEAEEAAVEADEACAKADTMEKAAETLVSQYQKKAAVCVELHIDEYTSAVETCADTAFDMAKILNRGYMSMRKSFKLLDTAYDDLLSEYRVATEKQLAEAKAKLEAMENEPEPQTPACPSPSSDDDDDVDDDDDNSQSKNNDEDGSGSQKSDDEDSDDGTTTP